MQFLPYGENALLINFDQQVDPSINRQVIELNNTIQAAQFPTITFTIPAYCSLTIGYDSTSIDFDTLCLLIKNLSKVPAEKKTLTTRQLNIPVCYEPEYALDLENLAKEKNSHPQELIHLHTSHRFQVYLLGFLPGFAYMGKLPEALICQRKKEPRLKVPALSVGLAGQQTGIYPTEAPGGWQIIGRTPLPVFNTQKEQPFLFQAGDKVHFHAITKKAYHTIEKEIATKQFNWDSIYA